MKTFKAHPRVRGYSKEENKRRYQLHKEIRKSGGAINTKLRMVFIPLGEEITNPKIKELATTFGYQLQTEAFTENRL